MRRRIADRFMDNVEVVTETGCWIWVCHIRRLKGKNGERYSPRFVVAKGRTVSARVWIFEREIGPVPEGAELRSGCGVAECVNPNHSKLAYKSVLAKEARAASDRKYGGNFFCGHPKTEENSIINKDRRGRHKTCRQCTLERRRRWETEKRRRLGIGPRTKKTYCKNGHAFTPENTYSANGRRRCRACDREKGRAWRAKNAAKVAQYQRTYYYERKYGSAPPPKQAPTIFSCGHPRSAENTTTENRCRACKNERQRRPGCARCGHSLAGARVDKSGRRLCPVCFGDASKFLCGHPRTKDNMYQRRTGQQMCRACAIEKQAKIRQQKR